MGLFKSRQFRYPAIVSLELVDLGIAFWIRDQKSWCIVVIIFIHLSFCCCKFQWYPSSLLGNVGS